MHKKYLEMLQAARSLFTTSVKILKDLIVNTAEGFCYGVSFPYGLIIYDVSNLSKPVLISTVITNGGKDMILSADEKLIFLADD